MLDTLAIGAHPDDVELGCGGTVAVLVERGYRVGILHLTRGETGSRGNAERRRREAERAAEILGVVELAFLDCGDGGLRTGPDEVDALISEVRRLSPDLVLAPTPSDRHPDHGRAYRLVEDACYYAGLRERGDGDPHRPAAVVSYMQHDPFAVDFVVDVSAGWETKMRALDAYESQLHQPPESGRPDVSGVEGDATGDEGPTTKISTPGFRQAIEGRARHFGLMIGAELGEPFRSRLPLAVSDPMTLLPGGVR